MRSTGIGRDGAADTAIGAAGGVGRVEEAAFFDGVLECLQNHAGFGDGDEIIRVDFEDAIHPFEGQSDAPKAGTQRRRNRNRRRAG